MIRAATPADVEGVLELWRRGADEGERPSDTTRAVLALLTRDPGALMLATDGARIVGSVIVGWDGWRGHVYRLAVDPAYRRAGVGTALLQAAEARAREQGCTRMDAIVHDDNRSAYRLWSRHGYERQTQWSRWVKQLDG